MIFRTKRRIKLGIWGLGRGHGFLKACRQLHLDVVAGCDFDAKLRARFAQSCPGALVTDDAEAFLASNIEAVLVATYCPAHAGDAIRCLRAGKHVLSEVTAFHTLAEGVALVEAVAKAGMVYNLAENYPFSRPNLYLAAQWQRGLFGELQYAEAEYLHDTRALSFTYLGGTPIEPGWKLHHWRSWQNWHYYNTHSLGPIMHITGRRPVRVTALPVGPRVAGVPAIKAVSGVATSLIEFDNGGVMRNLMGAVTGDDRQLRLWGTRAAAEQTDAGLFLRLGGHGHAPKRRVNPRWPALAKEADAMGHGGGDFWVLYQFARQILTGEPAFFDVYRAADCTLPGILALRSAMNGGQPFDVPDFRQKKDRDRCRHDHWAQPRHNLAVMPAGTTEFNRVMRDLIAAATKCRAALDCVAVGADLAEPATATLREFLKERAAIAATIREARQLARKHPRSEGARLLNEMLAVAEPAKVLSAKFAARCRDSL